MSWETFAGGRLTAHALASAARAHEGQTRKDRDDPYIIHPVRVMFNLLEAGITDDEYLAAALLHDVVEDTPATLDDVKESFGEIVARLVDDVTEQKYDRPGGPKRPWKLRKQHCIHMVRNGMEWPSVAIKIADQIDNLSSTLYQMQRGVEGEDFWENFGGDEKSQYWYSKGIYQAATRRLDIAWRKYQEGDHEHPDVISLAPQMVIPLRKLLTDMSGAVYSVFGALADDLTNIPEDEEDDNQE